MLQHLTIQNFALIDHYEINFEPGMSVVTGETGAGKSILIDALGLCLGARADSKMIRHGATHCDISAEFLLDHLPQVIDWLKQAELNNQHDCLLRRTINSDGKSRAFINGRPVTVQQLGELGELLVDLHGQHEHHLLLKREQQLFLLDAFGQHQSLLNEIKSVHAAWQLQEKEKKQLNQLQHDQNQLSFIQFQLQELAELNLAPNELEQLEMEYKKLNQSEDILQRLQTSLAILLTDDLNVRQLLQKAQQELQPLKSMDASLTNCMNNLAQADVSIQEAAVDLKHYLSNFTLSPERLTELSSRLDQIYRIARKHKIKAEDLYNLTTELKKQLDDLQNAQQKFDLIEQQQQINLKKYQSLAEQLSQKRQICAKKLSQKITVEMQKLAMPGGEFEIKFQPQTDQIHPKGQERCEFWVKPNPGQIAQPLNKIASGGELSRISLAIQVILAAHNLVPTLIFDEVDVGIGGATATIIGQLLRQIGKKAQVLCVTHLPQVAAFGNQHYQVEKNIVEGRTCTTLKKLTAKNREEEIARMLGGIIITPQSLAHAKELIKQAS